MGELRLVPAIVGAATALIALSVYWALRPAPDTKMLTMAQSLGVDPGQYGVLWNVMESASLGKKVSKADFSEACALTRDSNPALREAAFDALRGLKRTEWRPQALQIVENMKLDAQPSIRRQYPWTLFVLGSESWRAAATGLAASNDPKDQEAARRVFEVANN